MLEGLSVDQIDIESLFAIACALQVFFSLYLSSALRNAVNERTQLNKEMYGLVKRVEALTAGRREQILRHYDKILANLSVTLPPTIAAEAGQLIFETESKILSRLAELEPDMKSNELARRKMDELIKSMENLEGTLVAITAEAVRNVLIQSRSDLIIDESQIERSLAA